MICPICSAEFEPKRKTQKCCSKECQYTRSLNMIKENQKNKSKKKRKLEKIASNIEWYRVHNPMALCPKEDCKYKGSISNSNIETCDFLYLTGIRRGMPVEECTRHKEEHKIIKEIPVTVRFRKEQI